MNFFERLEGLVKEKKTCLCVGLDPRPEPGLADPTSAMVEANRRIIEATIPFAAAYKPNMAFYEARGLAGFKALAETIKLIPKDIPIILDAKRCDIGATAEAYAQALFGELGADAVTLSPYMGRDAVEPFLAYEDRGLFLLCRTSNPGAAALQDLVVRNAKADPHGDEALYMRTARLCSSWSDAIGLVVAGNDLVALRSVRACVPRAWFLAPGIGAQGGRADEAFSAGAREDGLGILVVAARALAEAADPAAAARKFRDEMETARLAAIEGRSAKTGRGPSGREAGPAAKAAADASERLKEELLKALVSTGCFKLGDFVLKSGKRSPFYIDLRRLVSDPAALALAAKAYALTASFLAYDRIAGIPAAALPLAAAASLEIAKPMLWPRMPVKDHGTGNKVEGAFSPGERVLLLDDLITTGASKLEAAAILRGEGLVVKDLAVLIERGRQGRIEMEAAGIAVHAFVHVRELFSVCEKLRLVDAQKRRELEDFVDSE